MSGQLFQRPAAPGRALPAAQSLTELPAGPEARRLPGAMPLQRAGLAWQEWRQESELRPQPLLARPASVFPLRHGPRHRSASFSLLVLQNLAQPWLSPLPSSSLAYGFNFQLSTVNFQTRFENSLVKNYFLYLLLYLLANYRFRITSSISSCGRSFLAIFSFSS